MGLWPRLHITIGAAFTPWPGVFVLEHAMNLTKENIKEHVDIDLETSCWNWRHAQYGGYGRLYHNSQTWRVHRFVYALFVSPIPKGLCVCHHCDNPLCVNPKHLFLGTNRDNTQDAMRKGRLATGKRQGTHTHPESRAFGIKNGNYTHPECRPCGEKHGRAKLTAKEVVNVRCLCGSGTTQRAVAALYGVHQATISLIIRRKKWKSIK